MHIIFYINYNQNKVEYFNSFFIHNLSKYFSGGAISIIDQDKDDYSHEIIAVNIVFSENSANLGSAINYYCDTKYPSKAMHIIHCLFNSNDAGDDYGGGSYSYLFIDC